MFVHASITPEPFGQVIVEAMLAGVPVIVPAQGGPSEIVTQGEDGLLYPAANVEALAQALKRMRADASLRDRLASNARERALRFSPVVEVRSVMALYRRVHEAHTRGTARSATTAINLGVASPRSGRGRPGRPRPRPTLAPRQGARKNAKQRLALDERPLRIFIDGAVVNQKLSGLATYIGELAGTLARQPGIEVCVATSNAREWGCRIRWR